MLMAVNDMCVLRCSTVVVGVTGKMEHNTRNEVGRPELVVLLK